MRKTYYKLQFLKKIVIVTTLVLLMISTDINMIHIVFCAPDANDIKQLHNNLYIMDYTSTQITFTGCMVALRSVPVNARIVAASSITAT